ncbi:MAG: hypothetical protein GX569_11965 [Candidatus Riflebacteria bacterium]|nr:hypothetical protein [Candidatus Riflebacteria bacterium]
MIDGAQDKKTYRKAVWFWGSLAVILLVVILHAGRLLLMTRQWLEIFSRGTALTAEHLHKWENPSFAKSLLLSNAVATQSENFDLQKFDFFTLDEEISELDNDFSFLKRIRRRCCDVWKEKNCLITSPPFG